MKTSAILASRQHAKYLTSCSYSTSMQGDALTGLKNFLFHRDILLRLVTPAVSSRNKLHSTSRYGLYAIFVHHLDYSAIPRVGGNQLLCMM